MKKIILILLFLSVISCDNDDHGDKNSKIIEMRIKNYQQPMDNNESFYGLAYIVQINEEIGTENWSYLLTGISGFDYELGYVYDLTVIEKPVEEILIDRLTVRYELSKINSKIKVDKDETFEIFLSYEYSNGFELLIEEEESSAYYLINSNILIDCGELCEELNQNIEKSKSMKGTFKHIDNRTIKLLKIH